MEIHLQNLNIQLRRLMGKLRNRRIQVVLSVVLVILLSIPTLALDFYSVTVTIFDSGSGQELVIETKQDDISLILEENGFVIGQDDLVVFDGITKYREGRIEIQRAIEVDITADGNVTTVKMASGRVADALARAEITVGEDDLINIGLNEQITAETSIVINRVEVRIEESIQAIAFGTDKRENPLYKSGYTKTIVKGQEGQQRTLTQLTLLDGVVTETEIIESNVIKNPVTKVVEVGTGTKSTTSQLDQPSGFILGSNGEPLSYSKVFNGRATAYTAKPGVRTASGRPAGVGHVAVNPSLIPYGTRLYIATPSGSYVYGIAVAADTGGALRSGYALVDIYLPTIEDCYAFGVKNVNVYVLD
ncbi:MAG: G5 domain-containing protein [Oscillospiraceae bacterium]|nr:G5 domain-containing protein [Oscillospiraceae bacterium]